MNQDMCCMKFTLKIFEIIRFLLFHKMAITVDWSNF